MTVRMKKVNAAAVKLVLLQSWELAEVSDLFITGAQMPIYKSWYNDPEKLKYGRITHGIMRN